MRRTLVTAAVLVSALIVTVTAFVVVQILEKHNERTVPIQTTAIDGCVAELVTAWQEWKAGRGPGVLPMEDTVVCRTLSATEMETANQRAYEVIKTL